MAGLLSNLTGDSCNLLLVFLYCADLGHKSVGKIIPHANLDKLFLDNILVRAEGLLEKGKQTPEVFLARVFLNEPSRFDGILKA